MRSIWNVNAEILALSKYHDGQDDVHSDVQLLSLRTGRAHEERKRSSSLPAQDKIREWDIPDITCRLSCGVPSPSAGSLDRSTWVV